MVPHFAPTYAVKWRKSKKMLESYIDQYNSNKRLGERLRSSHKKLAEYLLFLYSVALAREQSYAGQLKEGQALPLLRTNNQQLADELGCTDRTIINLRSRLKAAGVIKREIFHGTNAQYEVELSARILHLQDKGEPDNAIYRFLPGFKPVQQCDCGPNKNTCALCMAKSFRDTVSSTKLVTNKLIELDGANLQPSADNQSVTSNLGVSDGGKAMENCLKTVENPQMGSGRGTRPALRTGYETAARPTRTSPPVAAHPPKAEPEPNKPGEFAPDTLAQALVGLSEEAIKTIKRYITVIWTCANLNLYSDKWICDEEAERGRARLAEYFIYASPKAWTSGSAEIIERIMLVRKWIERGRKVDQKRWVPLPANYFDFRNPKGFRATKKWYKDHRKSKAEIKANELLTKAVKEYLRSHVDGAKHGPSETYRRISQRLGKYDRSLLDRFHQQIADHATANETQVEA